MPKEIITAYGNTTIHISEKWDELTRQESRIGGVRVIRAG